MSIIPPSLANVAISILVSRSKTSISTYGRRLLLLNFGLHRNFSFVFVIADVSIALLGANFLDTFDLKVDVRRSRLEDHATSLCIQGRLSACSPLDLRVCRPPSGPGFADLLNHYPQLLATFIQFFFRS